MINEKRLLIKTYFNNYYTSCVYSFFEFNSLCDKNNGSYRDVSYVEYMVYPQKRPRKHDLLESLKNISLGKLPYVCNIERRSVYLKSYLFLKIFALKRTLSVSVRNNRGWKSSSPAAIENKFYNARFPRFDRRICFYRMTYRA